MSQEITEHLNTASSAHQSNQPDATETIGITYIPHSASSTLRRIVGQAELQMIQRTLEHTGWNRKLAAARLQISYRGLLYKIRRHGITPPIAAQRSNSEL
jgi:DNA-binding NtrC family response regulator